MPIASIQNLPIGNAIRLFLSPPLTATEWILLRKTTNDITVHTDVAASVIHHGVDHVVLDTSALLNGTPYFYRVFWFDGTAWTADANTYTATPAATYSADDCDPLSIVRERLELGLIDSVAKGRLQHARNKIQVLNAPPLASDVAWPVVTIHLVNDAPGNRAMGEFIGDDEDGDGWLSAASLRVVGWTLNPDERIALRQELKRIVLANLPVFDALGLYTINFTQSDQDDFETYSAPVYQVDCQFTCEATSAVSGPDAPVIVSIPVTVTVNE